MEAFSPSSVIEEHIRYSAALMRYSTAVLRGIAFARPSVSSRSMFGVRRRSFFCYSAYFSDARPMQPVPRGGA